MSRIITVTPSGSSCWTPTASGTCGGADMKAVSSGSALVSCMKCYTTDICETHCVSCETTYTSAHPIWIGDVEMRAELFNANDVVGEFHGLSSGWICSCTDIKHVDGILQIMRPMQTSSNNVRITQIHMASKICGGRQIHRNCTSRPCSPMLE